MIKFRNILLIFDLDFTLIDNSEGVENSFNYALKKYNLPAVETEFVKKAIGLPLTEIFSEITTFDPLKLTEAFREFYGKTGMYQVKLLPGIKSKLNELKNQKFPMIVLTSKKQELAIKLINYMKIDDFFKFILGETEERKRKIDPATRNFLLKEFPNHNFVMIGDHPNDRKVAELLNCPFVGVLTGVYNTEQLTRESKVKVLILNGAGEITPEKIFSLF